MQSAQSTVILLKDEVEESQVSRCLFIFWNDTFWGWEICSCCESSCVSFDLENLYCALRLLIAREENQNLWGALEEHTCQPIPLPKA